MDIEAHMNTFECSICTSDKLITHMNIQGTISIYLCIIACYSSPFKVTVIERVNNKDW